MIHGLQLHQRSLHGAFDSRVDQVQSTGIVDFRLLQMIHRKLVALHGTISQAAESRHPYASQLPHRVCQLLGHELNIVDFQLCVTVAQVGGEPAHR